VRTQDGSALVVGLLLLSLITLLGLAGAAASQVELQLARNEQFRENAASAAAAGIEIALRHVTAFPPDSVPARLAGILTASGDRYEVTTRLLGHEFGLPQESGANLAAAHFEILSSGFSARGARDRQRMLVAHVVTSTTAVIAADCEPATPGVRCASPGDLYRTWQRLPPE
jgi:hypothetical protein